jgi:hypothetical protein
MSFDHLELLNVWGRYKGFPSESCDDKLDRLSKLIGTLKSTQFGYPQQTFETSQRNKNSRQPKPTLWFTRSM